MVSSPKDKFKNTFLKGKHMYLSSITSELQMHTSNFNVFANSFAYQNTLVVNRGKISLYCSLSKLFFLFFFLVFGFWAIPGGVQR